MISVRESAYLDLVRAAAALIVLLGHAAAIFDMKAIPLWGHHAVMVFFVLSGYVICYTADVKEKTLRQFVVARFARLWSVLIPAIVLTILCDLLGRTIGTNPGAYAHVPADHPLIRTFATLSFSAESWLSIQPFSNGAVWSLCVEFWYYMLFAAWVFLPSTRLRTVCICAAAIMSGHKGLLLLPVWLMGTALQRATLLRKLSAQSNLACFTIGAVIALAIMATRAYDPAIALMQQFVHPWIVHQLAEARVFWFDWLLGLAVMGHLLGARSVMERLPIDRIGGPLRWCAGISFSIYLFHFPLLTLCSAFMQPGQGYLASAVTLAIIAVIGPSCERSKRWWRTTINRALDASLSKLPALAAETRLLQGMR